MVIADVIFESIFYNKDKWILINIAPKFVPKVQINIIPALGQTMSWPGLGFFRPKPVSSGQNGKNWIKPVLSSFFRPKLSKTDQNWTK